MAENNVDDFDEEKEIEALEKSLEGEKENGNKGDSSDEDDNEEEKENKKEEEDDDDDDEEPATRKNIKDYIIERKEKKIKKLEKEKEEAAEAGEEDEDDLEDTFSKDDKEAIEKVVEKSTAPFREALRTQADRDELNAVIANHPEAKAMEKKISKYMVHPAYQSVPVENIYLMLAGKENVLQTKKEQVKVKDKKNQSGGHTRRKVDGAEPDYKNMSDEEFDKLDEDLMTGQL